MWLHVEHRTRFSYDEPVTEAFTELRMKPMNVGGQRCSSFRLALQPVGSRLHEYGDHFGNEVLHFNLLEPHEELTVTVSSDVFTPESFDDGARELSLTDEHDYLMETPYTPQAEAIGALAAGSRGYEALMAVIQERLIYERGATDVTSTADEVLELGRGVCQDFAHLFIAASRAQGVPARYVSGYLYDSDMEGQSAASHAWVDVWSPGRGWVSLDPTHGREQTDAYIRVAVGRDYADVPPTRGVYSGVAIETLDVAVELTAL
jgi:transglutaminase-like putative cysteine protease